MYSRLFVALIFTANNYGIQNNFSMPEIYLVWLSRLLLPQGDRFSFKKILKLEEYAFEDLAQSTLKGKFSYSIQIQGRTTTAVANGCLFYTKTAQAKTEWLKLVGNAV